MSSFRKCPFCQRNFERMIDGQCPHCHKEVPRGIRVCPNCEVTFTRSVRRNGIPHCPQCDVELYYPKSNQRGQTILLADKECAAQVVSLLEMHISTRDKCCFVFEGSERNAELVHAYSLVDRSKTYLRKQPDDLNLDPHAFTLDVVRELLKDPWWAEHIKSLVMIRNHIGKFAQSYFKQKKLDTQINQARKQTFIDYSVFAPVWN